MVPAGGEIGEQTVNIVENQWVRSFVSNNARFIAKGWNGSPPLLVVVLSLVRHARMRDAPTAGGLGGRANLVSY